MARFNVDLISLKRNYNLEFTNVPVEAFVEFLKIFDPNVTHIRNLKS